MSYRYLILIILISFLPLTHFGKGNAGGENTSSQEQLTKALEYFQGGKYHEAILCFTKLQKRYKLNPRFLAYLGMCYYKEGMYEEAIENLREGIPALSSYSPKEQAVYSYYCAESLFEIGEYTESLHYYNLTLSNVQGNDRADVLFHTAFAYYLRDGASADNAPQLITFLSEAQSLYEANTSSSTELQHARLQQTRTMLAGLNNIVKKAQAEKEQNTETQKQSENPENPNNPKSPENPDKTEKPESPEKLESPEKPTTEVTPQ